MLLYPQTCQNLQRPDPWEQQRLTNLHSARVNNSVLIMYMQKQPSFAHPTGLPKRLQALAGQRTR